MFILEQIGIRHYIIDCVAAPLPLCKFPIVPTLKCTKYFGAK